MSDGIAQAIEWLSIGELDEVATRFAHHREVAHAASDIRRSFDKRSGGTGASSEFGHLFSAFALESKVVQGLADLAFEQDDHELRVCAAGGTRADPYGRSAFRATVSDHAQSTDFGEEADRTGQVAYRKGEVGPSHSAKSLRAIEGRT